MKNIVLSLLIISLLSAELMGQVKVRKDDHFWRRKVVNRIDLQEKINQPLTKRESSYYTDNSQFSHKKGLVMALFDGLKKNHFLAYKQDSLNSPMTYDDVKMRIKKFEGDEFGDFNEASESPIIDEFDGEEEGFWDEERPAEDDDLENNQAEEGNNGYTGDFDPGPYENVIQFVEDRIFDKARSEMVYDIQFIELIWTDPGETLPERYLCTFKYQDVVDYLDGVQWKNRFNDAEYRTIKEIFELRLFHSFITQVSGVGVTNLQESESRRKRIVEFEHNLWSF